MFQTNFYGTVSLPLCRILYFKLTTEPPKEQAQRWSFCIIVFFMSTTFYEISRKSAQKTGPLRPASGLQRPGLPVMEGSKMECYCQIA